MSDATAHPIVVVPCLDEARSIRGLLESALTQCPDVIVVDDGSTDGTAKIASTLPLTVLRHPERRGKGEALRTGFREALRRGASGVLTMDGDGQHDPSDIPRFLAAARHFPGALVIGARMLERGNQPNGRRRANAFGDWGIGWACGQPVADTQSGQRWYPRPVVELVDLRAEDFVFEAAILIAASRELAMPIVSIPIACRYDTVAHHSHFRGVRDTLRITAYTARQIFGRGHVVDSYRASRATRPTVYDPDGRLDAESTAPFRRAGVPPAPPD